MAVATMNSALTARATEREQWCARGGEMRELSSDGPRTRERAAWMTSGDRWSAKKALGQTTRRSQKACWAADVWAEAQFNFVSSLFNLPEH
jgi:hypothetical protein